MTRILQRVIFTSSFLLAACGQDVAIMPPDMEQSPFYSTSCGGDHNAAELITPNVSFGGLYNFEVGMEVFSTTSIASPLIGMGGLEFQIERAFRGDNHSPTFTQRAPYGPHFVKGDAVVQFNYVAPGTAFANHNSGGFQVVILEPTGTPVSGAELYLNDVYADWTAFKADVTANPSSYPAGFLADINTHDCDADPGTTLTYDYWCWTALDTHGSSYKITSSETMDKYGTTLTSWNSGRTAELGESMVASVGDDTCYGNIPIVVAPLGVRTAADEVIHQIGHALGHADHVDRHSPPSGYGDGVMGSYFLYWNGRFAWEELDEMIQVSAKDTTATDEVLEIGVEVVFTTKNCASRWDWTQTTEAKLIGTFEAQDGPGGPQDPYEILWTAEVNPTTSSASGNVLVADKRSCCEWVQTGEGEGNGYYQGQAWCEDLRPEDPPESIWISCSTLFYPEQRWWETDATYGLLRTGSTQPDSDYSMTGWRTHVAVGPLESHATWQPVGTSGSWAMQTNWNPANREGPFDTVLYECTVYGAPDGGACDITGEMDLPGSILLDANAFEMKIKGTDHNTNPDKLVIDAGGTYYFEQPIGFSHPSSGTYHDAFLDPASGCGTGDVWDMTTEVTDFTFTEL